MSFLTNSVCLLVRPTSCLCRVSRNIHSNRKHYKTKLHKIGTLQDPNFAAEPYPAGTLFLHKIFPYRGIVVHSRKADIHESKSQIDVLKRQPFNDSNDVEGGTSSEEDTGMRTRPQFYYMVLPDMRDVPQVNIETGFDEDYMDFVLHEDILPYKGSEKTKPVEHISFNTLFVPDLTDETSYVLNDSLDLNTAVLPSDVYRETTENVRVTVTPQKVKSRFLPNTKAHLWQYYIRLENRGSSTVTLRERVWKIADKENGLETKKGRGVVGKEPVLSRSSPAFQYSSFCTLETSSGWMWGKFIMERENGTTFECNIPKFQLKEEEEEYDDTEPPFTP